MARFDLKNTSRNRSNWIVTKTYFEPAYFNITHIPVQRAFTVFSKYSGQSSMISLTWKIASTSLFRFLQFSCNCCCSTICLPAGGLFSNFSWREGKKKNAATTCEKRADERWSREKNKTVSRCFRPILHKASLLHRESRQVWTEWSKKLNWMA